MYIYIYIFICIYPYNPCFTYTKRPRAQGAHNFFWILFMLCFEFLFHMFECFLISDAIFDISRLMLRSGRSFWSILGTVRSIFGCFEDIFEYLTKFLHIHMCIHMIYILIYAHDDTQECPQENQQKTLTKSTEAPSVQWGRQGPPP